MGAFSFNMILSVLIKMLRSSIQTECFFYTALELSTVEPPFRPTKTFIA